MSTSTPPSQSSPSPAPGNPAVLGTTPGAGGSSSTGAIPKPRKACDHCRASKSKCESIPGNERGACQRCVKTQRTCVFGQRQQRKVRKRPSGMMGGAGGGASGSGTSVGDDKVERLERKIAVLEASLPKRHTSADDTLLEDYHDDDDESQHTPSNPTEPQTPYGDMNFFYRDTYEGGHPSDALCPKRRPETYEDVVQRGVLSLEAASGLYKHFITQMLSHFPFFMAPPDMTQCRSRYPVIFAAALAASAGTGVASSGIHHALLDEVYQLLADRIVRAGEKSVELCQALMITTTWHHPCALVEESRLWTLTHQASVMAIDIEYASQTKRRKTGTFGRELSEEEQLEVEIEGKRTLLTCWMACASMAVVLRRPMMPFGKTVQSAIDALSKTHPKRTPRDMALVELTEVISLMIEAAGGVGLLEDESEHSRSPSAIAFVLETFEKRLGQAHGRLEAKMSKLLIREGQSGAASHSQSGAAGLSKSAQGTVFSVQNSGVIIRLFGVILNNDLAKSLDRPFFSRACVTLLTTAQMILDNFCGTPAAVLATSPWQVFSRAGGAASTLVRMSLVDTSVPSEHLKIPEYLGRLSEKLSEVLQKFRIRAVAMTLSLTNSMLNWFLENTEKSKAQQQVVPKEEPSPRLRHQQHQPYPPQHQQKQQHHQQQSQPQQRHSPLTQARYPQQHSSPHSQHSHPSPVSITSPPPQPPQYPQPQYHRPQMHHQNTFSPPVQVQEAMDVTMHSAPPLIPIPMWQQGHHAAQTQWADGGLVISPNEIESFLAGVDGQTMFGSLEGIVQFHPTGDGGAGGFW